MPTDQQVATAMLAIANAALPAAKVQAYEPSKVPSPRPAEHVVMTLVQRTGGVARAGRYVTTGWAVYFMAASQVSEANARNSLQRLDAALLNRVLVIDGVSSNPVRRGAGRPIGPDDDWSTGVKSYEFTL